MTTIQLVKRNVLVFVRDRGAVFFSLLAMIIVILLQSVFLGNLNVEALMELLEQYGGSRDVSADRERAEQLVNLWTIGGLLVVNSITVSLTVLGKMVSDREENRLMSFSVAPVKRVEIALGYMTYCQSLFLTRRIGWWASSQPMTSWTSLRPRIQRTSKRWVRRFPLRKNT